MNKKFLLFLDYLFFPLDDLDFAGFFAGFFVGFFVCFFAGFFAGFFADLDF